MTPEQARERFSDAHEGTLAAGEQHAFDRLLAQDAELRHEYEQFRQVVRAAGELSAADPGADVDLLPGLQARLRAQSGGRIYRDRFSQSRGTRIVPAVAASILVLICAALFLALRAGLF